MQPIIIFGNPEGQHLRAELENEEVVLYSHELTGSGTGLSNWRHRTLVAIPKETWIEIARQLGLP